MKRFVPCAVQVPSGCPSFNQVCIYLNKSPTPWTSAQSRIGIHSPLPPPTWSHSQTLRHCTDTSLINLRQWCPTRLQHCILLVLSTMPRLHARSRLLELGGPTFIERFLSFLPNSGTLYLITLDLLQTSALLKLALKLSFLRELLTCISQMRGPRSNFKIGGAPG